MITFARVSQNVRPGKYYNSQLLLYERANVTIFKEYSSNVTLMTALLTFKRVTVSTVNFTDIVVKLTSVTVNPLSR